MNEYLSDRAEELEDLLSFWQDSALAAIGIVRTKSLYNFDGRCSKFRSIISGILMSIVLTFVFAMMFVSIVVGTICLGWVLLKLLGWVFSFVGLFAISKGVLFLCGIVGASLLLSTAGLWLMRKGSKLHTHWKEISKLLKEIEQQ